MYSGTTCTLIQGEGWQWPALDRYHWLHVTHMLAEVNIKQDDFETHAPCASYTENT